MKVYELLSDPKAWMKGCYARNDLHSPTLATAHDAVCWCLEGAIQRCYPDPVAQVEAAYKLKAILEDRGYLSDGESHIEWNDDPGREHAEVVALCKEADV